MKYIVLIFEGFLRDTQVYTGEEIDDGYEFSDEWSDFSAPGFLGIAEASSAKEAVAIVAEHSGYPEGVMKAIWVSQ